MMRKSFREQLINSGYLHMLLKPDLQKTAESRLLTKKPLKSRLLWNQKSIKAWTNTGHGKVTFQDGSLKITVPARVEPAEPMPHYTGFNNCSAVLPLFGEDWREYNRLIFKIKPDCPGMHKQHITVGLRNDGIEKIPDIYNREGAHVVNLENNKWNDCVWEFPDMPRDKITELSFSLNSHGKERFAHDTFTVYIQEIWLECIENADVSLGWQGNPNTISFSTTGYWLTGQKIAVANQMSGMFEIVDDETNQTVFSGEITPLQNEKGIYGIIDFTEFNKEGYFYIKTDEIRTKSFAVGNAVMEEAAWKVLNYIYSERCGYPVGGGHTSCHSDIIAIHNGLTITYNGGWHDAGDLSQQTIQTGEVVQALLELAVRVKDKDTLLYRRLMEEARWGLDFVLRTRFEDGYRAFSVGLTRWTNGFIGDFDSEDVRCHNRSFDNWLLSGVQAFAGYVIRDEDPELSWVCIHAAKEDYKFAESRFDEIGTENCVPMEHTYNASLSQYYAAASWAASQIFNATGDGYFAEEAVRFGNLMLACQDTGEAGLPFDGFFYRTAEKKHIVHFSHQSREYLFTQALRSLCITQKENPLAGQWESAMRRYADYQKAMCIYSLPYKMIPTGVYRFDEYSDMDTFALLNPYIDYHAHSDNYREQLACGIRLDKNHCMRHFPVWFSFRGNTTVQLAAGKAASLAGSYFGDEELLQIARDQLYWISGRNPFCQSLIYGEGSNYAQQYAALCGETVGELPVGIQTKGNEDVPYWPMATNATYKEIWLSSAGHWMRLLADIY